MTTDNDVTKNPTQQPSGQSGQGHSQEKSSSQRTDIGTGSVDPSTKNPSQGGPDVETDQRNKIGHDNDVDQQKKDQQKNQDKGDQRIAS
jgi:hypothetical protein